MEMAATVNPSEKTVISRKFTQTQDKTPHYQLRTLPVTVPVLCFPQIFTSPLLLCPIRKQGNQKYFSFYSIF